MKPPKTHRVELRIDPATKASWEEQAAQNNLTLSQWILLKCTDKNGVVPPHGDFVARKRTVQTFTNEAPKTNIPTTSPGEQPGLTEPATNPVPQVCSNLRCLRIGHCTCSPNP